MYPDTAAPSVPLLPKPARPDLYCQIRKGFVAENFEHMLIEESRHNAALWEAYSDAKLLGGMPAPVRSGLLQQLAPHLDEKARARLSCAFA